MPEYLSPGVYVEEFDSGAVPMEGVGTSTAGFIGIAEKGPVIGVPQLITNFSDYMRIYGGHLSESEYEEYRYLPYAVEHFFINGGSRCFVMRVAPSDAVASTNSKGSDVLKIIAANPGSWGDKVRVEIAPSSKSKTQMLESIGEKSYKVKSNAGFNVGDVVEFTDGKTSTYNKIVTSQDNVIEFELPFKGDVLDTNLLPKKVIKTCEINLSVKYDDLIENYEFLSFNRKASNFIESRLAKSDIVKISFVEQKAKPVSTAKASDDKAAKVEVEGIVSPFAMLGGTDSVFTIALEKGSNGAISSIDPSTYIGVDNGPGKRTGLQSFVENTVTSIMAIPGITDPNVQLSLIAHCENLGSRFAVLDVPRDKTKIQDVLSHRDLYDTNYAAMYHPWVEVFDPKDKKNIFIPPSGSVVGVYSRSDIERGVHKAPANEVVRGCSGLECLYNEGEQDILNPAGVNLIRSFTGRGIRVWGARTCSSNGQWKYINVRRLFIFLEESIKANTNWVVFEPNNEVLWARVQRTISLFLASVWRSGALAGNSPQEAYFVNIGRNTMSQDDIDNGRLICTIGVAPVKPAEFVIFRITQKTSEASE